jgi:hypothetical protein
MGEHKFFEHLATAMASCVVFGIVLRIIWEKIKESHTSLKKQIDDHEAADDASFRRLSAEKKDRDLCDMEHKQIEKDFEDGRVKFRDLMTMQSATADRVNDTVTRLALITQRLELVLPQIEAATALRKT